MSDELPKGWVVSPLSELLHCLESGGRPKGGVKGISHGVPSIGGEHLVYAGCFDFSSTRYVPTEFAKKMTKGHIKKNDILIVKDGATTGKTAFVGHDFPFDEAVVNEHVFLCRLFEGIEPRFVFRFLTSKEGQEKLLNNFQGSAQGGINLSFAPNTEIPFAPLAEQCRIVAKLEMLLGKVDACQKRLAKIPVILKRFRQSVLAAACSGRLTADWREKYFDFVGATGSVVPYGRGTTSTLQNAGDGDDLPERWGNMELGALIHDIQNGLSRRSSSEGKDTVVLRLADIVNQKISLSKQRAIKLSDNEIEKYRLREGDILVVRVNGSTQLVGNFILYDRVDDWTYCDHLIRMRVNDSGVVPKFLIYLSRTDVVRKHINNNMVSSAGQNTVSQTTIKSIPIPLPPLPEQQEIVRRAEALFKKADEVEARYKKAKVFVDRLTQSILAKAFLGELVPQDPNDEPASVLLEKIKTEKGRLEVAKKMVTKQERSGKLK